MAPRTVLRHPSDGRELSESEAPGTPVAAPKRHKRGQTRENKPKVRTPRQPEKQRKRPRRRASPRAAPRGTRRSRRVEMKACASRHAYHILVPAPPAGTPSLPACGRPRSRRGAALVSPLELDRGPTRCALGTCTVLKHRHHSMMTASQLPGRRGCEPLAPGPAPSSY